MRCVEIGEIECADAITHGGVFHADDVLATAILERARGGITVCRVNRVPDSLPEGAIVFDIGGGVYDHHGPSKRIVRANGIPYAAAGLIWRDYGMAALRKSDDAEAIWMRIERELIQGVDAHDCGIGSAEPSALTFSQIVSLFNLDGAAGSQGFNNRFCAAVRFAGFVLDRMIGRCESDDKARCEVEEALRCSAGSILVLPRYVPWKLALFESDQTHARDICFVVYPSARGGFCWQCVPKSACDASPRLRVPRSWWGLSGQELHMASGVADAEFCHPSGFIGAAKSLDGALAAVLAAIDIRQKNLKKIPQPPNSRIAS